MVSIFRKTIYKVFTLLLISTLFLSGDAGMFDNFNIKDMLMKNARPVLQKLPKLLPSLNGKVASESCRRQGHEISEHASKIEEKDITDDALIKVFCLNMDKECFMEYIEALKPLAGTKVGKKFLNDEDVSRYSTLTGPLYTWMCTDVQKEAAKRKKDEL